jgi:hypothetical protein
VIESAAWGMDEMLTNPITLILLVVAVYQIVTHFKGKRDNEEGEIRGMDNGMGMVPGYQYERSRVARKLEFTIRVAERDLAR